MLDSRIYIYMNKMTHTTNLIMQVHLYNVWKTSCSGRNHLPRKLALKTLKKISNFIHIYCSVSLPAIAKNADIRILWCNSLWSYTWQCYFFSMFKNSLSSNHSEVFRILTRISKTSVPNIIAVGLYREILNMTQFEKF